MSVTIEISELDADLWDAFQRGGPWIAHSEYMQLKADNAKLRELATYALRHIIEAECEELDRETLRGKPCEDCVDYGSSDCPKCMPRMFDVSGIEVD